MLPIQDTEQPIIQKQWYNTFEVEAEWENRSFYGYKNLKI